jgi:hypothetical protein
MTGLSSLASNPTPVSLTTEGLNSFQIASETVQGIALSLVKSYETLYLFTVEVPVVDAQSPQVWLILMYIAT